MGSISALVLAGVVSVVVRELQEGGAAVLLHAASVCAELIRAHALHILGFVVIAGLGGGAGALIYYLGRGSRASRAK